MAGKAKKVAKTIRQQLTEKKVKQRIAESGQKDNLSEKRKRKKIC